jgi:hypothetical protein
MYNQFVRSAYVFTKINSIKWDRKRKVAPRVTSKSQLITIVYLDRRRCVHLGPFVKLMSSLVKCFIIVLLAAAR